jgi:hypothetical protein
MHQIDREAASEQVRQAQAELTTLAHSTQELRLPVASVDYVSHGVLTRLLIPLGEGDARYDALRQAAQSLKAHRSEPLEYRLLRLGSPGDVTPYTLLLKEALSALNNPQTEDDSAATITADRSLDRFYDRMPLKNWQPGAQKLLELHTQACHDFIGIGAWDLARNAHDQADEALAALRLMNRDKALVKEYEARLAELKAMIDAQDPSLLRRIGRGLNRLIR